MNQHYNWIGFDESPLNVMAQEFSISKRFERKETREIDASKPRKFSKSRFGFLGAVRQQWFRIDFTFVFSLISAKNGCSTKRNEPF